MVAPLNRMVKTRFIPVPVSRKALLGPVSERRLAFVHPTLAGLIRKLAGQLSEPIGVTQGLRTFAEQAAYYAQGRQALRTVNAARAAVGLASITAAENKRTVTNAKPGYSWHCYGLAADIVPFESSGEPDWNVAHPIWDEIVSKSEAIGLVSGVEWEDEPHLQMTAQYGATPDDAVRQLLANGGLKAVWDSLVLQNV